MNENTFLRVGIWAKWLNEKESNIKSLGGGDQNHTHTRQRRHIEISSKFGITGLSQIFTDHVSFKAL